MLLVGMRGDDDDDDDNPRGNDNVDDVQPYPPNTQQPAIVGRRYGACKGGSKTLKK
jgi:hypothetical protein